MENVCAFQTLEICDKYITSSNSPKDLVRTPLLEKNTEESMRKVLIASVNLAYLHHFKLKVKSMSNRVKFSYLAAKLLFSCKLIYF